MTTKSALGEVDRQLEMIVRNHDGAYDRKKVICDRLRADGDFEQEARASANAVSALTTDLAVYLRHPSRLPSLGDSAELSNWFGRRFRDAVRSALVRGVNPAKPLFAGFFGNIIYASLAAGNLALCEELASSISLPGVVDNTSAEGPVAASHDDVMSRLVASAVRADHLEFERQLARWELVKRSSVLYSNYYSYPTLLSDILNGKDAELNEQSRQSDELFRKRILEARFKGDIDIQDDCRLAVDLRLFAVVQLARYRGLHVTYSSETLPKAADLADPPSQP